MTEYHPRYPQVQVKRQNRKSIVLSLSPEGNPILRIPHWLPVDHPQVKSFLKSAIQKLEPAIPTQPKTPVSDETAIRASVKHWAQKIGVKPERVQFRAMTRKWGSCSSKGNITLNTALFYVPQHLMEYVVVHELVHMIIFNHSAAFWAKLADYLPDYAERERELDTYKVW
jgi:hypothetical protein